MVDFQPAMAEIITKFEESGLRWTVQRQLILQTVQHHNGHLSVDEIHNTVTKAFPSVNRSTVYRTLEVLSELGMIVKMEGHNNIRLYELAHANHHHHAWCETCGGTFELKTELINQIKAQTWEAHHIRLSMGHFVGWGVCPHCAEQILN